MVQFFYQLSYFQRIGLLYCSGLEVTRWQVAWGTCWLLNPMELVAKITFSWIFAGGSFDFGCGRGLRRGMGLSRRQIDGRAEDRMLQW
jgi:hypothetical protein